MRTLNIVLMRADSIRLTIRVLMTQKKKFNSLIVRLNANLKIHMILVFRMV